MSRYSPTTANPPSASADVLNPARESIQRDSAYYSCAGEASKHTSVVSTNNQHLFTPPATGYSPAGDKTPSPVAANSNVGNSVSPTATSSMTVASMVSPTTPLSPDASMLAKLNQTSHDLITQRTSGVPHRPDSPTRRDSVVHGFEGMRLANSPYASQNQSTTSITSSLQQQRNPGAVMPNLPPARFSNSYQPGPSRFGSDGQTKQSRTAPTITGPATSAVAHAAEPTKGQPWAFPDVAEPRMPAAPTSNVETASRQTSYLESRRSSVAESFASSQYTAESRLPQGQRRLEDGYPNDYSRVSRGSGEFQGVSAHHHHQLQHKQIGDLRDEDAGSPGSGQPYSRTPELRISHKLAERKRRNEMKELYDELRDLMPQERGSKASKWEILSKAIAEHRRQDETIRRLQDYWTRTQQDLAATRDEATELRHELRALRAEVANMQAAQHHHAAPPLAHQGPPPAAVEHYPQGIPQVLPQDQYPRSLPIRNDGRAELPPLRSIQPPPPDTMMGVQYHHDVPQPNGYRPAYPTRI